MMETTKVTVKKVEKVDYHHRHRDGRCANVLLALSALFHNLYEFFFFEIGLKSGTEVSQKHNRCKKNI